MKRLPLALFSVALLAAVALPVSEAIGASGSDREPPICREMTPAKMLEHPALAQRWSEALRSAEPDAIARVREMIAEIRAAHGCGGTPEAPSQEGGALPPGHPPIPGTEALPPGHPPVHSAPPPLFQVPDAVTI